MSDRRIKTTYEIVYPSEEDVYPEIENDFVDEVGESMEPDDCDIEEGLTAVDKAIAFLNGEYVSETSGSPWSVGDWYSTEPEMNYRTGETKSQNFHLEGFTPEEERAVFCGVLPKEAARYAERDRLATERAEQMHRRLAVARPHGMCERADYCLEHEQDQNVPSCKARRPTLRKGKGRRT